MAELFAPQRGPDFGLTTGHEPRVLQADFGDGFAQRARDGINSDPLTLRLSWTNLTESEKDEIDAFLVARGGYEAFDWQMPTESSSRRWVCPSWSFDLVDAGVFALSATFREVFDP